MIINLNVLENIMPSKFSYYLDEKNQLKDMDHFEAIQLNKAFFEHFNEEEFKTHAKKILLQFHPDKNSENKEQAHLCFQRVYKAYEVLKDPIKREQYLRTGDSHPDLNFNFDFNFVYQDWDSLFNEKVTKLDELNSRFEQLYTPQVSPNPLANDSLEKIATEFAQVYKGTMVRIDVLQKQFDLFNKIKEKAKTPGEFYALQLIVERDPTLDNNFKTQFLQQAAANGHILAMSMVASRALAGHFSPLEESVRWGLECFRFLENTAMPKLEQEDPHSAAFIEIKDRIESVRERRAEILPKSIPTDPEEFNKLVNAYVEYRKKRGGDTIDTFNLTGDIFAKLAQNEKPQIQLAHPEKQQNETPQTHPTLPEKQQPVSNIQAVDNTLRDILHKFETKIDKYENEDPKVNKQTVKIARDLSSKLSTIINTYLSNIDKPEKLNEAKTEFIKDCTSAINDAKPKLEKQLGWGDYLSNLLKSLVNTVIKATNFLFNSKLTLFTPTQAPLKPEVEDMEQEMQQHVGPNKK